MARSIDYLVKLYPDKTGKEIQEIHNNELNEDAKEREFLNIKYQEIAKKLNDKGYFKGNFGINQYYYYHFTNISYDNVLGFVGNVEKIIIFYSIGLNEKHRNSDLLNIRIEEINNQIMMNYGLDSLDSLYKETTKEEYELVKGQLTSIVPTYFKDKLDEILKEYGK